MAIAIDTLDYARRLRQAGFSEEQATGQAQALAAAMTDSLATKQDLRELETRLDTRFAGIDGRFAQIDTRFDSLEKHVDVRFDELDKRFDLKLAAGLAGIRTDIANLQAQMMRMMVGSVVLVSALVKLL